MHLPDPIGPMEFDQRYRLDFNAWRPAILEICTECGLEPSEVGPFTDGSNLVAAVDGEWVVKVFPPFHRHQWDSERQVLPLFADLPVAVPELVAQGERADGYTYVVVSMLEGDSLEDRWESVPRKQRAVLMEQIGRTMAAAHDVPTDGLVDLQPTWRRFLPAQIGGCRQRHRRQGAPRWVTDRIDSFVLDAIAGMDLGAPHVVLTGEYTPFNLLFSETDDGPALTGMLDFGDAMVGPAAYDLLGPAVFLGGGDKRLLRALFEARGLLPWPLPPQVRRGLLALLLVHRYSDLEAQVRVPGWQDLDSLERLADTLFGG